MKWFLSALCLFLASCQGAPEAGAGKAVELGKVNWLRSYETAVAQSKKQQKPLLILFQEVPG